MYLKSVDGKILFEGRFTTLKNGLEMAIENKTCLDYINLRHANLSGAALDNAQMDHACLWGANLNNVDLTAASLKHADFRASNLLNSCLAESNCSNANFEGAYFSRTIFRETNLKNTQYSCPSIFSINLAEAQTLEGAVYSHLGEIECDLSHAPLIIQGLHKPMIFMDNTLLIGTDLKKISARADIANAIVKEIEMRKLI